MVTQVDYFAEHRYHHVYNLGDRVRGLYNGIPFSGSVDIDTKVYENEEPYIIVYLDLPIKFDNTLLKMIKVKHKDLIGIEDSYDINRKTDSKKSTVGSNKRKR